MSGGSRILGLGAILASTCFEAIGQVAFKRAADPSEGAPDRTVIGKIIAGVPSVLFGIGSFVVEGLLWSLALYNLDISVAHPIGSIVFVDVTLASRFVLGEKITPLRWAGVGFIIAGSVLVAVS